MWLRDSYACVAQPCPSRPPNPLPFRFPSQPQPRRVSGTHAHPLGMKTDAPWEVVWDVMRCWVKEHPVKKPAAGSAGGCVFFWGGGAARADRALAEPA
jgi:hypothetical protein